MTKAAPPAKAANNGIKFKQDSADFALLVKMFQNGDILPTEKPAAARSRYEVFHKYTGDQFRAQYSKAKTMSGVMGTYKHCFQVTILGPFGNKFCSWLQLWLQLNP